MIAVPPADGDEVLPRALAALLAVRQQVDAGIHCGSNLRMARPQATISDGASIIRRLSWMRGEACISANGLATLVGTWVRVLHHLVEARDHRRAAGEQDVVDRVVLRRGEEELQRALHFHGQVLHERLQHLGLEVVGQAAGALGVLRLLRRHAVAADDVLGELVAAERLLARVDRLVVAQHGDVHHVGADVDHRDVLVLAAARQRPAPPARARSAGRTTRRPSPAASGRPSRRPRRGPRPFPCASRRSALPAPPGWSATGRAPGNRGSLPRARTGCTGSPRSRPGSRAPPRAARPRR